MAVITDIQENFEAGSNGAAITTANSIYGAITGLGSATFSNDAYEGSLSAHFVSTANVISLRSNTTAVAGGWFGFAFKYSQLPSVNASIFYAASDTITAGVVRFGTNGTLSARDGTINRWSSPVLSVGQWYWCAFRYNPGSATGMQLKIYSGQTLLADSGNQTANQTAATTIDNIRVGILSDNPTADIHIDRVLADTTTEPAPLVSGGGGGATEIMALHEDFEQGLDGAVMTTADSIFTNITGSAVNTPTFSQDSYDGQMAILVESVNNLKTMRVDISPINGGWFGFAFKYKVAPSAVAAIFQFYEGTTAVGAVRLNTSGALDIRDGTSTRWTSAPLTIDTWYWCSFKVMVGSATGLRLKIYSGSTLAQDSGDQSATSTVATTVDNLRFGVVSGNPTTSILYDRIRGDTATEVGPAFGSSLVTELAVETFDGEPYRSVSLTATSVGGSGTGYTYAWQQTSGTSVSLSGSGATRTFTAPATMNGTTLQFSIQVTDSLGAVASDTAGVAVLPHNEWVRVGGSWTPSAIRTKVSGSWTTYPLQ